MTPAKTPSAASRYILSLDQGTSSSRAILFDHKGTVVEVAQQEFAQHYPKPGWVEHDAQDLWDTQLQVARDVLKQAGVGAEQIAAIGIANQRETTVIWDRKTGQAIAPAIVWQDRRTGALCDELREAGHADDVQARTGLVLDAYFSATKIKWILDHVEGARERAKKGELIFGTVDSWLVWHLTEGRLHATDVSNASRTMLFNIHKQDWDDTLLAMLDIPRRMLPAVYPSSAVLVKTSTKWFGAEIPIAGIAGDQQAATFGQTCFRQGMTKNTYGTGCFLLMNTGAKPVASRNRLLTTIAWKQGVQVRYALEGSIFMGGATIQWLRDALKIIDNAADIDPLASQCEDTDGVMLVPAFAGLGAPYWDPYARGTLIGLTRGTGRPQIARAALEGIALQSVDVLAAMQKDAHLTLRELRVDGGAARSDLLMQIQADLLNTQVVRPQVTETTALGAAYLAGLAVGYWENEDELAQLWQVERVFEPTMSEDARQHKLARWHRAVERARDWERD